MPRLLARVAALLLALLFAPADASAQEERSDWLDIELGKSIVLETPRPPKAIAVTEPLVANPIQLGSPTKWQIQGINIGTTDLIIQYGGGIPPMIFEITVHRDLSDLIRRIDQIVEGEPPRVYPLQERIVVQGPVSDLDTLERVAQVASIYDREFVNLMTVQGDHQVQLEVVFAEVNRTALKQLGFNFLYLNPSTLAGITDGTFSVSNANDLISLPLQNSVFNVFGLIASIDLMATITALDQHSLGKVLAQPTLVALSGQQAEFLSGGELPVPTPNAQGAITIKFRPYGTQLLFKPTVLSNDVIDVHIEIEMSAIDDSTPVRLAGVSVPGLTSRKAKSHVRLESGMTFAIAGLLSETTSMQKNQFPGLGAIPIIGTFFRSVSHQREEMELIIYVTPRLVRPMAPGEAPPIPGATENNNPSDFALFFMGADHRYGSRTAAPTGVVGLQR